MNFHVSNSPFTQEQVELLNRLLPQLTGEQQLWLSGYLAGNHRALSMNGGNTQTSMSKVPKQSLDEITVLFGSETGNAQQLAENVTEKLKQNGFHVNLVAMNDYKFNKLKKERCLLIVVSTHGEGEPPDNAAAFYEFLHSRKAPELKQLKYSVLALGDSSYEFFCQTGKDFDKRLEELGAQKIHPRQDCDLDFDEPAAAWFDSVMQSLQQLQAEASEIPAAATVESVSIPFTGEQTTPQYSRSHPFQAEVLENINLIGRGSSQEVRHLELSIEGSGFQYEPGDCLGIYPQNHPELVDTLIDQMQWHAEEQIAGKKDPSALTLREALLNQYEITQLTKPLLKQVAEISENNALKQLVEPGNEQELRKYIYGRDVLDLVQDFSLKGIPAQTFVPMLRKLPARLYSIASSQTANPDEVHLTIKALRYHANGRDRYGVCSVQCAERVQPGDTLPVYLHRNPNFKMPADPSVPIIMVGPGTGVAPFRAFMEEREETGAEGKSWLFFGNRHFHSDFLYQTDWQRWLKQGILTKMDVAFSRDSDKKVYVQHRMLEKGKELYNWLQEGASIYICGDEKHMAKDVHEALLTIVSQEGGMNKEEAEIYLSELKQQKRYQRDVY